MSRITLIAGLGNPGSQYAATRHNAGFWFVDEVARRHGAVLQLEKRFFGDTARLIVAGRDVRLLKPHTYMNRSAQAVQALAAFYKVPVDQILVVHDELDLPPGQVRLKSGGGHGGHNGLRDLIAHLGGEFLRLRIGIGHPGHRDGVHDYVLGRPSGEERPLIEAAVEAAADALPELLAGELQRVMNRLHAR